MKTRFIVAVTAALLVASAAFGQDLKPVKDKSTKLFGYQDKSKNWVVPPAYFSAKNFKDGLAEVTVKPGKTKLHGIIDATGREVIPPVCNSVSVNKKEKLIFAERETEAGLGWLWGVYDYEGNEIWAPQFASAPVFYDGRGIARSAENGLKGVIDVEGKLLVPFENLALERAYGGYEALSMDFVRREYDSRINVTSEFAYPGYVIPYDPEGDPVRAAAWHAGPIGYRLHRNNLRLVQVAPGRWGSSATCNTLPLDWGDGRFVRLEPVEDPHAHPGSMEDPFSGKLYTVAAVLCEADGTQVKVVSEWGWLDVEFAEGIIYNSEGKESWMIMRDVNCPPIPAFSTSLSSYRTINKDDVISGLGIYKYELENMYVPERFSDRAVRIITGENAGITYRMPPEVPGFKMARAIKELHRTPLFHYRFRVGDIVNCRVRPVEGGVELELADGFVCRYEDRFSDPYFSMTGEEPLYWGPANEYSVILTARQAPNGPDFTKDDVYGSDGSVEFALELYDGLDRYIQTIAMAPSVDFCSDGWIVLGEAGIALRVRERHPAGHAGVRPGDRPGDRYSGGHGPDNRIRITGEPLPPLLSALNGAFEHLSR